VNREVLNRLENDGRRGPAGISKQPTLGLLVRLGAIRDKLPTAAQAVADYILGKPEEIVRQSVTEVAEAVNVSEGTVVRLCKRLGVKGFQDLKTSLVHEMVEPVRLIHEDVQAEDDALTVANKVFRSDIQALEATMRILEPKTMQRAIDIILNAQRVEFYGIGSSGPIAVDAYYRLMRVGIRCAVTTDSHMQAVNAALTDESVAVVTISHSGSTIETVEATRLAKAAGAKTICITNYGKSPIQAYADVVLFTVATETMLRTEAMASRIVQLSLIDTLCVNVALANLERALTGIARSSEALSSKRF
jgi:RpiR family transcriptional regulator, carbohydrate utilization regulator